MLEIIRCEDGISTIFMCLGDDKEEILYEIFENRKSVECRCANCGALMSPTYMYIMKKLFNAGLLPVDFFRKSAICCRCYKNK